MIEEPMTPLAMQLVKLLSEPDELETFSDAHLSDRVIVNIGIHHRIEHVPVRARQPRLSWREEVVPTLVRRCSASDFAVAFRITRNECDGPVDVLTESGDLWWPVGKGEADRSRFLRGLRSGNPTIVGLIDATIRDTSNRHEGGDIQSRRVIHDYRDAALARTHRAATNLMIVDGSAYIRGGRPLLSHYPVGKLGDRAVWIFNEGVEFGRPVPVKLTGDRGVDWLDDMNLRKFVAHGQVLTLEDAGSAGFGDHGVEVLCDVPAAPFDLPEYQMQLLVRDLVESVDDNAHFPLEARRGGLAIHRLCTRTKSSFVECVQAVTDLDGWLSDIDPSLRQKFLKTERLMATRLPLIEATCRAWGRPPIFSLAPIDDEWIAGLLV